MSSKKRKISGLSGLELQNAYDALRKLKASFVLVDEETDPNEPAPEGFEEQVDTMRGRGCKDLSSSGMTPENLDKLKITPTSFLGLKPDIQERITTTTSLGKDSLWSSDNLYRHLLWLEGLIPPSTEASAGACIDAFFFRASAMLAADKRMVVNMEHAVRPTTVSPSSLSTLSGFIAVVTSQRNAEMLLSIPELRAIKTLRLHSFFIVEAKLSGFNNTSDQVPQAVAEMYASGKILQTKFVRGALTNGREWIFLHLKFTDDYEGASYLQSSVIEWTTSKNLDGVREIPGPWPDLIAAILADWIENSFVDIGSDDWFKVI